MFSTRQLHSTSHVKRVITASLVLVLAGLLAPLQASPVAAAGPGTLSVDTVVDDPGATACTDAAPADCSLRGALINSDADGVTEIETVVVPAGTYDLTVAGDGYLAGSLNVRASVVLVGAGPASTIVDAHGIDRVLVVNGEGPAATRTLTASGFTFRGGRPCNELGGGDDGGNVGGGGLFVHGVAHLTDVIIEDNLTCGAGGGIHADKFDSALTLTRTVIRGNTALGGAGGLQSDFSLTMIDSTVSGNLADRSPGGGLRLAGAATITGSTISNNVATVRGGGITSGDDTTSGCCAATVVITNSTISGNVVHWWNSGTPQYFPGVGGGIHGGRSRFTLRHVTVTANVAETNPNYGAVGRGGGITTGYTNFLTLENSIVAGNVGAEECRLDDGTTYSTTGSFGCSLTGVQDPQLGSLAANGGLTKTHAVAVGNPAIDAGVTSVCSALDQRGEPRPSGAGCDIGAFELQVAPPPPPPPPPPAGADAVVVVTTAYVGDVEDPLDHFRFDLVRQGTSIAAFDGSDLFGPTGPIGYVVGVDILDDVHGDAIRVTEDTPAGWLTSFSGDCAADGSLPRLHSGKLVTCEVTNLHLDEFQPAPTAAVVIENSFRTPPTVDLRDFDVSLVLSGETIFEFDAQDLGQAGRRTLGFAVPAGNATGVGVMTSGPAGWLAILGADCADYGRLYLELGKLSSCTIEWFEVGIPPDPIVDLVIDDCSAAALATVTVVTGNVIVTDDDCASLSLPALTSIAGNLVVENNATLTDLSLSGLGRIDGDLVITGNASLVDIDLGSLAFIGGNLIVTQNTAVDELATAATGVGGDIDVSQNATLTEFDMPDVETVGGDMTMTGNPTLTIISMPAVETVGGDIDVSGNATLTDLSAPTLTLIGGDIDVSNNASMTLVSAPSVTTIGGDVDISGNSTLTTIEMPTVTTIGGDIDVSNNTTVGLPVLVLHLPALISVGGSILISENVQLVNVEASSMTDVGGDVDISGNTTLTTISVPDVEAIGGNLNVATNPDLTTFEAPSLETVGGDLILAIEAVAIQLATVSVGGDTTIVGTDTEMLVAETALGTTSFQLLNGLATLQATLPDGAFETNVAFSVERLTGSNLDPQGSLDPLAAYHLDFDATSLGLPAAVTLTIDLEELTSADRQSLQDAIASGRATLAVRADGATTFEALTVCATGQTPSADDCIQVLIDSSIITFNGVAGHFSTWAVVVTAAPDSMAPAVTVPSDKQLDATGPTGRTVAFADEVSALDDHDGVVATQCIPASGSAFPIGLTRVTCRAVDAAGNEGSAAFRVTIVDTTGPTVSVPSTVTVPATGATGAVVTFAASATDLVSGPQAVVCTPASGSRFPIGQTTVTCRASDAAGNVGIGSFLLRVLGPVDLLTGLRNDVASATPPLTTRLANDLTGKLNDAIVKLGQTKTADACKKVHEFMTKVDKERAMRTIPAPIADAWLTRATQIRTLMGC